MAQSTIAASFAVQPEATSKYPYLANPNIANPTDFINQVYQNLFNRAADAAGLAYWTAQLTAASGNPTAIGNFILNVISGATGTDDTFIRNKTDVAKDFTTKATNANTAWTATVQNQSITEIIATTTDATVVTQKAATDTFIAAAPGPSLNLTVNTDTLASGATNASFNGALFFNAPNGTFLQTITTGDNLSATGTGASMTGVLNTAGPTTITTSGIARVELANQHATAATAVTLSGNMTGVTTLANVGSTNTGLLTVGSNASGLKTALTNLNVTGSATFGSTSALIAAAALTGTTDALAINVTGALGATGAPLEVSFRTDSATNGTVATPQNSYETVNLSGTGATFVNLGASVGGGTQSTTTLNVSGAGAVSVFGGAADNFAKLTTINASTATGNVTITGAVTGATGLLNNTTNVLTSFKGGSGADSLDVSNFSAAQMQAFTATNLDGGTGRDTLILGAAAAQTTTALNATGFEIIGVSAATGTINVANFGTGVDTVSLNGTAAAGAITITNAPTAFTFAAGSLINTQTLTITGPTTGSTDTLTLTGVTNGAAQTFGAQTFNGYESITETFSSGTGTNTYTLGAVTINPTAGSVATLNIVDNLGASAFTTGAINVGQGTLNISGTSTGGFTLGTAGSTASVLNASGLNTAAAATDAGLTMNFAQTAATVITGSAGLDTLRGSAAADTINAGAGNDLTRGNELGDTINVGSGTDTIFYVNNTDTSAGVIASGASLLASTGTDIVTGMANNDKIDLASLANLVLADGAITVGTTFAAAAANQALFVSGSYNTTTGVFTSGAASATNNDYLLQYSGGTATNTVNTVVLVDIVGTVTAASATEVITLTVA